jgi:chromate transport protein ChrA
MDRPTTERDLQRRVFVSTFRMSPFAAAVGAFVGWSTGGYYGAAVGATLMALVAMPVAGLIGYGIARRMDTGDR